MSQLIASSKREDKFIVGLDVDLTIADTLTPWINWANRRLPASKAITTLPIADVWECVDLVPMMREQGIQDPLAYWKDPALFQKYSIQPKSGSRDFIFLLGAELQRVTGKNVEFIVVSHCFPEHKDSKKLFIQEHFGDLISGFIDTSDKQYVDFDLIVDDNATVVNKCFMFGKKAISPWTGISRIEDIPGCCVGIGSDYHNALCLNEHAIQSLVEYLGIGR